jgi:hypothetical protein
MAFYKDVGLGLVSPLADYCYRVAFARLRQDVSYLPRVDAALISELLLNNLEAGAVQW